MPDYQVFSLISGLVLAVAAALVGVVLVLRRNSMIADGLSHVGVGALALAVALGFAPLPVALILVSLASIFILRLSENHKIHGDAAIAVAATSALSLGVLFAGDDAEELEELLLGNLETVSAASTLLAVLLCLVVVAIFIKNYRKIFAVTFDENFAKASGIKAERYNLLFALLASVTVVLGMRLVGSLLISSLTIFPVLSAESVCKTFKSVLISSVAISVITFFVGFCLALALSLPVGATIVLTSLAGLILFKVVAKLKKV